MTTWEFRVRPLVSVGHPHTECFDLVCFALLWCGLVAWLFGCLLAYLAGWLIGCPRLVWPSLLGRLIAKDSSKSPNLRKQYM